MTQLRAAGPGLPEDPGRATPAVSPPTAKDLLLQCDWAGTPLGVPAAWPSALRTLVQTALESPLPMAIAWGSARTLVYNAAFRDVLGDRHPRALGRDFVEAWPELRGPADAALAGLASEVADVEVVQERGGRLERSHYTFHCSPVREGDAVAGLLCTCTETTAHVAASERLQLALDAGAIVGTWVWEIPSDRIVADDRFARAFGLPLERCRQGLSLEEATRSIHPEDAERVGGAIRAALAAGGPYRCEYRVRGQGGEYRWVEAIGHCECAADGMPLRFPGILLDIEDRHRAEAERDRTAGLLRHVLEAVPGVVYAKDRAGRMLLANRGTAELVGQPLDALIGKTDAEFLDDEEQARAIMALDRRVMDSGQPQLVEEVVNRADGSAGVFLSRKAPLLDEHGRVMGIIGASLDITERKRQQEEVRTQAEMLELLNRTGASLAAELDLDALLQSATDAATRLTGARFGAFFYNGTDEQGEALLLYTLSGAPREAFARFGHPRPTPVFEPTFRGSPPVRVDDILRDPRYGQWAPHRGMPPGHLPVRSYLAVSVVSRTGAVLGGMFFGHPEPGVFTQRSEALASGIAAQAAIAIDNARLYAEAQRATAERNRLLESERAARSEAERASKLKDEFLATLSHELRTPLSSIVGWVHILRRKLVDPALLKGVDVIERSTRVQTQLIEDLLDMSRITSGKLALNFEDVAPATFVEAAVDAVQPSARDAGLTLRVEIEDAPRPVHGDAARLQQVVWNLLANAIKFTPHGGTVAVSAGTEGDRFILRVADTGVGIRQDFLQHVFERFRQADGSITRRFGGLGLGLSIVKQLVEMHGGSIDVASAGEGQGTTFTVELPLAAEAAAAADAALLPHSVSGLEQLRVLVVDDEPDVLELLQRVLAEAGADVRTARNAQEALEGLHAYGTQVLVSDIGMPGMDGHEMMRRIRASGQHAGLLAVALTAFARPEDRQRALHAGFDEYLTKPVTPALLLRTVARLASHAPAAQR